MQKLSELTSNQEVIEYVRDFLLNQGKRSVKYIISDEDEIAHKDCRYRGGQEKELRCAIGCLISDENYSNKLEGFTILDQKVIDAVKKSVPNWKIDVELLQNIQNIHDCHNPLHWEWKLNNLFNVFSNPGKVSE